MDISSSRASSNKEHATKFRRGRSRCWDLISYPTDPVEEHTETPETPSTHTSGAAHRIETTHAPASRACYRGQRVQRPPEVDGIQLACGRGSYCGLSPREPVPLEDKSIIANHPAKATTFSARSAVDHIISVHVCLGEGRVFGRIRQPPEARISPCGAQGRQQETDRKNYH